MKALILLLLFASPVWAYDPWTDCAGDVMCRKARAGQERLYQQWAVEEQEREHMNKRLDRTRDGR